MALSAIRILQVIVNKRRDLDAREMIVSEQSLQVLVHVP